MLLIWDVMGGVMGVVWDVANFTALLFFPGGNPGDIILQYSDIIIK